MRRDRVVGGVERASCRMPAMILAVAAILAVCGWCLRAEAAGGGKGRKKAQQNTLQSTASESGTTQKVDGKRNRANRQKGVDEPCLRYLPDDCRVFGYVDYTALRTGQSAKSLGLASSDTYTSSLPLDVKPDQFERIVVGARTLGTNGACQYVFAVHCSQPLAVSESHPKWSSKKVGERTVWVCSEGDQAALCAVQEKVFLIGFPDTIDEVLRRDGPARFPAALDRARRQFDPKAHASLAILPTRELLHLDTIDIPVARDLLDGIDAVNVEFEFTADLAVQMAAFCRNEATAQQLNGIGKALWAIVQAQGMNQQPPGLRRLCESAEFGVHESVLTASVEVPSELIQLTGVSSTGSLVSNGKLIPTPSSKRPTKLVPPTAYPSTGTVVTGAGTPHYRVGSPYASGNAPSQQPYAAPAPPQPYGAPTPPSGSVPSPYSSQGYAPSQQPYAAPATPRYPSNAYGASPPHKSPPSYNPCPKSPAPTLPISDIVRMSEAGVDEEVMVRHIFKHQLEAALTADDLILLTESEVATRVITKLQDLPCVTKKGGSTAKSSQLHVVPKVTPGYYTPPGPNDAAATAPPAG